MGKKKSCSCGDVCGIDALKEKQEYENRKNAKKVDEQIANEGTDENKQIVDGNIVFGNVDNIKVNSFANNEDINNNVNKIVNETKKQTICDCIKPCDCGGTCDCKKELAPVEVENKSCCTKKQKEKKKNWFLRHKKTTIFLSVILGIVLINVLIGLVWDWDIVKSIWQFFSDQILGMKWLNSLVGLIIGGIGGQEFLASPWGASIQFFIYDTIKIIFLLCLLIFIISYIQSYFPPERTKKILSKFKGIKANIIGALLGTVTPFCSCSSIPIFIGFTRAGLSSGITFSFLISSPLVDLGAFILLASVFGFPIAITYVAVGLILAVIGGTLIEKSGAGKYVEDFVMAGSSVDIEQENLSRKDRLIYAREQVWNTFKKVWLFVLIGVLIGAVIHNWIPTEWIIAVLGQDKWYSVLVASLVGVPMYADIFGTIPIAEALFAKGVGVGTILAFMMSVTALSLPSMIMLRRAVKPKLLWAFIGIVTVGIILIGYIFNAFNFLFI